MVDKNINILGEYHNLVINLAFKEVPHEIDD